MIWPHITAAVFCGLLMLVLDRVTKHFFITHFSVGQTAPFIPGLLNFVYVRNSGGAWGMLSGKTSLLIVVTALVMAGCVYMLIRYSRQSRLLLWAIVLVLSGGVGNMIDRLSGGEVVDFLHFIFLPSFPVFNVADCAVVIGAGFLILYFVLDGFTSRRKPPESADEND